MLPRKPPWSEGQALWGHVIEHGLGDPLPRLPRLVPLEAGPLTAELCKPPAGPPATWKQGVLTGLNLSFFFFFSLFLLKKNLACIYMVFFN